MPKGDCTYCEIEICDGKVVNWHTNLEWWSDPRFASNGGKGRPDYMVLNVEGVEMESDWERRTIRFDGDIRESKPQWREWFRRWDKLLHRCPAMWYDDDELEVK